MRIPFHWSIIKNINDIMAPLNIELKLDEKVVGILTQIRFIPHMVKSSCQFAFHINMVCVTKTIL